MHKRYFFNTRRPDGHDRENRVTDRPGGDSDGGPRIRTRHPTGATVRERHYPGPDCHPGSGEPPSVCALQVVEAMLCPCIRGDACVCRALAREFETRAHRACDERSNIDMKHRETHIVEKRSVSSSVNSDSRTDERQGERRKRLDRALDAALANTFPASDLIALV